MFRIAVAGSIVRDTIIRGSEEKQSFGGITYNIVALLKYLENAIIYPIAYIAKDEFKSWKSLFKDERVKFDGIRFTKEGNRNRLVYRDGERDEFFVKKTPPIELDMLLPFIDVDIFLVNHIKNDDLPFETLKTLSYAFKGLLYMDIHSLLRDVSESGQYVLRPLRNWQRWVSMADILQMNKDEATYFTGIDVEEIEDIKKLALLILGHGTKVVNITLGELGAVVAYKKENFAHAEYIKAPKVSVKDPTGAGDVYGAAFISKYIKEENPVEAAKFAVEEASKCVEKWGLPID